MSEYLDGFLLCTSLSEAYNKTRGNTVSGFRSIVRQLSGSCADTDFGSLPTYIKTAGKRAAVERRSGMNQQGCSISEAVRKSGVEAYVLRYWEEEGLLDVKRNRKGHRCYTQAEFDAIKWIQSLKEEGYTLKDIREMKEQKERKEEKEVQSRKEEKTAVLTETTRQKPPKNEKRSDQKQENMPEKKECVNNSQSDQRQQIKKDGEDEKQQQFYAILERLIKEVAVTRNREARYRRLDEAIRRQQKTRQMIAAAEEERQEKGKAQKRKRK